MSHSQERIGEMAETAEEQATQTLGPAASSLLTDNIVDPHAWRSIDDLVSKILDPPADARPSRHGMQGVVNLNLGWAVQRIGENHFEMNHPSGRPVLKQNSKVRMHG